MFPYIMKKEPKGAATKIVTDGKKQKFYCPFCDHTMSKHSNYKRHLKTAKHLKNANQCLGEKKRSQKGAKTKKSFVNAEGFLRREVVCGNIKKNVVMVCSKMFPKCFQMFPKCFQMFPKWKQKKEQTMILMIWKNS